MSRRMDMAGQTFGRLTAVEPVRRGSGGMIWLFKCDCGNTHEAAGYHVRKGRIASCGCYRDEVSRRPGRMEYATTPIEERFWRHVDKTADGCWAWSGSVSRRGYGQVFASKRGGPRMRSAHRVAYELTVGPIPDGMELDHRCHSGSSSCPGGFTCLHRRCVNPDHLEPVTGAENMRRMAMARTHCQRGHEFTPENTYTPPRGGRQCRACIRTRAARRKGRLS